MQGHQGRPAVALDNWAGSSGTGRPPLALRSSERRRQEVGLQWKGEGGLDLAKGKSNERKQE